MKPRAFVLLETMLAVGVFAIGVIGLGYCVNNCLNAESARIEDQRARLALENRMAEIELGAVTVTEAKSEALKGAFAGMTLKQSRTPLKLKNEKNEPIDGLFNVELEISWKSEGQEQRKVLTFYFYGAG